MRFGIICACVQFPLQLHWILFTTSKNMQSLQLQNEIARYKRILIVKVFLILVQKCLLSLLSFFGGTWIIYSCVLERNFGHDTVSVTPKNLCMTFLTQFNFYVTAANLNVRSSSLVLQSLTSVGIKIAHPPRPGQNGKCSPVNAKTYWQTSLS